MNLALRILGVAIFISGLSLATIGAFEAFDRDPGFSQVELTGPSQTPVTVLAGGSTNLRIGAENLGDATENITLSSPTDGFTISTRPETVPVQPGQTSPIRARLSVDAGITGKQTVEVEATSADSGSSLGSISFKANVLEGQLGEVTLEPNLPAAIPGGNITLQAEAVNPVGTRQQLNLTVSGLQATVEPATLRLQPNGTATATVRAAIPSSASGSVTVGLTATNPSGDSTDASAEVPVLGPGEIAVQAVSSDIAVQPGNRQAIPILVVSNLGQDANVTASGSSVVATDFGTVPSGEALGGFATIQIPTDASGERTETITVTVGDATREVTIQVDTEPDGERASLGKQASVNYVGRLTDGSVFDSSLPEVARGPFPKSESFRARPGLEPISLTIDQRGGGTVPGFFEAVKDMTTGESKTVTLTPKEAYGPPRTHENRSATSEIPRDQTVPRALDQIPKQQLPAEFEIENATEGDVLTFETTAGDETVTFRFRLDRKGERTVDLTRVADEGETTTFYGPWPGATEVTKVNETHIVYTTTPPEDVGSFTWDVNAGSHEATWENATTVQSVNETTITLLHQPEVGIEYQASSSPRAPPQTYRVEDVNETTVHVSTDNQHPLAGKTLIFSITLVDVSEAPQRRGPMIGGGR